MAQKRKFAPAPIPVVETPEMRARIKAIADREDISQAQVIRELIGAGIVERERQSLRNFGGHT